MITSWESHVQRHPQGRGDHVCRVTYKDRLSPSEFHSVCTSTSAVLVYQFWCTGSFDLLCVFVLDSMTPPQAVEYGQSDASTPVLQRRVEWQRSTREGEFRDPRLTGGKALWTASPPSGISLLSHKLK